MKKKFLYAVYDRYDGWLLHSSLKEAKKDVVKNDLDFIFDRPKIIKLQLVEDITDKIEKKLRGKSAK